MAIRDVLSALQTLLATVSISAPVAKSIRRVYKFPPPQRLALADLPCVILTYEQEPVLFKPALLMKPYSIRLQVFVAPAAADADVSADIASEFLEQMIQTISGNMTLGGTVSVIRAFRGGGLRSEGIAETLTALEWAGNAYVGLDLIIDVTITEAKEHSA